MITTMYQVLQLVRDSGHTTLVIDDVAVDYELRDRYGVGLNDEFILAPGDDLRTIKNYLDWQHAISGGGSTEEFHRQLIFESRPWVSLVEAREAMKRLREATSSNESAKLPAA